MLGHNQGQMLNAAQLAAGLGISGQTVGRYLDLMVDLLLVRRLQPWSSDFGKRLVRSPNGHVRDTGLRHTLLGIRDQETLLRHPIVGSAWEGMLVENILSAGRQILRRGLTTRPLEPRSIWFGRPRQIGDGQSR
jgi:predicted AAA+ superfamily ATPase